MELDARGELPRTSQLRRLGEGREAEIFAWGQGLALRLLRSGPRERADREAAAMVAARRAGAPAPAAHEVTVVEGRPGLLIERVDGPDQLTVLGRRPWLVPSVGRLLGEVHARLHETTAPPELPELRAWLGQRITESERVPGHLADFAVELLEDLPGGDRLCHGDLHPGNVLLGRQGPVVIDWTNATRGHPLADVAWTRLLLRIARPQPSAPAVVRLGAPLARSAIASAYLRAYRRRRPVDLELVARWEPVLVADRLAKGIELETPSLTRLLERYRNSR